MERPGVRPQCDQRLLLDQRREVQRYRAASGRPARDLRYPDRLQILIGGEGGAAGRSPFSPPFCDRLHAGIRNGAAGQLLLALDQDRKRVVKGKRVFVRVDVGGRRLIKKTSESKTMYLTE